MGQCRAVDVPEEDRLWNFCPNLGADVLFLVIFAWTTIAHVAQAIIHRKPYCWVIIMSGLWQTVCYAFRYLSIKHPTSVGDYSAWFILILVAPLWTNAFAYMVLGRMVYNFTSKARLMGIKAWRFTLYFVLLDIVAFIIQAGGASIASGNDKSEHTILLGLHVYMGGVGFQQLFIFVFAFIAYKFQREIRLSAPSDKRSKALQLLYVEYFVLTLITVRIIFRLIEYSQGLDSTIPNHEVYQYIFDSLPMFIALVVFNVFHPGRIMAGKKSNFPSRRERKNFVRRYSNDAISMRPNQDSSTYFPMPEEHAYQAKTEPSIPNYGYVK